MRIFSAARLFIFAVFGVLCACTDSIERLRHDIQRLENNLNDLRVYQAEQTTKISAVEAQQRSLAGRLDEIEHAKSRRLDAPLEALPPETRPAAAEAAAPPPIVPATAFEEDQIQLKRLPGELSEPAAEGFSAFRQGNFQKALAYWDEALYLSSGTEWAPMAAFWRGVALDGLNEHRRALEAYYDLVKRFPKYHRTPLVMLRQASVLIRLNDIKTAKVVLNKLISDFPKSAEAAQARQRLRDL